MAAIRAEAGIVSSQAHTRPAASPQRTRAGFCTAPVPRMAPVIVCVVETGIPRPEARNSVAAPPAEAAEPLAGVSLVRRCPIVLMMRQPPNSVPAASAE